MPGATFLGSYVDLIVGTCQPKDAYQPTNGVNHDCCYALAVGHRLGQQQPRPGKVSWVLRD